MIKLISSIATLGMQAELIAHYQAAISPKLMAEAGGGVDVARRVQAGEVFDVVVPAADAIDQFVTNATLLAGSRVDLAKSGVAIAVTAGASVPGVAPKTP